MRLSIETKKNSITQLQAMGDQTRFDICNALARGESTPTAIAKVIGKTLAATSYGIQVLLDAKLVKLERIEGNRRYYCLNEKYWTR